MRFLLALLLSTALLPSFRAGESPEAALDRLAALAPPRQATELEYVLVQYRNGRRVEARGTAQYHADGKRFVNRVTTQTGDREVDVRMVCDGSVVWIDVREGGRTIAVQRFGMDTLRKLGGAAACDPKAQWTDLRDRYAFSETREGRLGEAAVTIFEGALKPAFVQRQIAAAGELGGSLAADLARPQLEAMAQARVYIDAATGRLRKSEVLDRAGQILVSFEVERLRAGLELDDRLFAFEPPRDAEVVDLDRLNAP